MNISRIFAQENRGTLLDIFVFLANLFLLNLLAGFFTEIVRDAADGEFFSQFLLFLFGLGLFILPPIGATLKRWHFHQRRKAQKKNSSISGTVLAGCLFNPLLYFCLNVLLFAALGAAATSFLFGNKDPGEAFAVTSAFLGVVLIILQTYFVYRYFIPPKAEPKSAFLRDSRVELIGDACIFLNVIFFQLLWNSILMIPMERPPNVSVGAELGFRFFLIGSAALLIYFPPRIFYLAEDISRPRTWMTILMAISPVVVRFMLAGI
jgi:hypothetical protein